MSNSVIVVGVNGSDGSRRALRWALKEADLRKTAVEVITAWPTRDLVATMVDLDAAEAQRVATTTQRTVIDEELAEFPEPPVVSYQVVHGDPVGVLVLASSNAGLLVIGSHNTSSLMHVVLGSVSEACARMAECPVVVLPMGSPVKQHSPLATTATSVAEGGAGVGA